MSPTVYLVTGANRGIGLAITTQLAARPDAIVFAGARDPDRATDLHALATANPGRVHILNVISADRANNDAAIEVIRRVAGRLDVVIANAGISDCFVPALKVPTEEMVRHVEVNTNGPLVLFQAAYPLLRQSPSPKFVPVTSAMGSIADGSTYPIYTYAYGASKAALNWVTRKLHFDFPGLVIFPIDPGGTDTDFVKNAVEKDERMRELMQSFPLIPPETSARGILEQVDAATRETHGGQFVNYAGLEKCNW
ncbi:NAD(P)-binding protein [Schizophyllum commune Loenen D]|nr:NAD(P)-binding protein [Schizophyllum commune Loenen D]